MTRPGELLDQLAVRWNQATDPDHGYDGTFNPAAAFGHWTASPAGSDTATSVVVGRHYHACVARNGIVQLGGWQVRQGHGGEGRTSPLNIALDGAMTLEELRHWQTSTQDDDTSSMPNERFYGVSIDNDGIGEPVPDIQWHAWTAAMAAFTVMAGATSIGHLVDHSASTARKVDLSGSPAIDPAHYWTDIATQIALLLGGPTTMADISIRVRTSPSGHGLIGLTRNGGIFTLNEKGRDDIQFHGSLMNEGVRKSDSPASDLELTPNGDGYWILTEDGHYYPFGNAGYLGDLFADMNP